MRPGVGGFTGDGEDSGEKEIGTFSMRTVSGGLLSIFSTPFSAVKVTRSADFGGMVTRLSLKSKMMGAVAVEGTLSKSVFFPAELNP